MIPAKPTILYVDDEEDNLLVFKSAFRRQFKVLVTSSAEEALETIKQVEIPLIITDQRMPEKTGVELLKEIPEENPISKIILTGFSDVEVIIEAINNCNIFRYITKPWDKEELNHTITLALEHYYLNKDNTKLLEELKEINEGLEKQVELRTNELMEEKERAERLLLNILPAETARELQTKGRVTPRRFDNVTIIFTDIVDFTIISENFTPDQLISELDYYFRKFDEIFEKYGVEKIKTSGDAYIAVCGVPMKYPDHATRAVNAAREAMAFVNEEYEKRKLKGEVPLLMRMGIHSGSVIAGVVGKSKFAFDIWGDDVNLASRMESSGEVGKINISQTTYNLIENNFNCTHRGKVLAKNKGEIDMYFVDEPK